MHTVALLTALGASVCAAAAAALQSRSAHDAREPVTGPTEGLLRFAASQLTRRLWWGSLLVQACGFILHGAALHAGALSMVQPLMASAVVLALPLNHYLNGVAVSGRELLWGAVLATGLTGFLLTSAAGRPAARPDTGHGAALAITVGLVLITGCFLAARGAKPRPAAALLGAGAAIAFTAEAAFLQTATGIALTEPSHLLTSGTSYGMVVAGVVGVGLTQLAYRAGPMSAALPTIITVNPLLSIVLGLAIQHESFRHTPTAIIGEILNFAVLCLGAIALSAQSGWRPRPPERTPGRPCPSPMPESTNTTPSAPPP